MEVRCSNLAVCIGPVFYRIPTTCRETDGEPVSNLHLCELDRARLSSAAKSSTGCDPEDRGPYASLCPATAVLSHAACSVRNLNASHHALTHTTVPPRLFLRSFLRPGVSCSFLIISSFNRCRASGPRSHYKSDRSSRLPCSRLACNTLSQLNSLPFVAAPLLGMVNVERVVFLSLVLDLFGMLSLRNMLVLDHDTYLKLSPSRSLFFLVSSSGTRR